MLCMVFRHSTKLLWWFTVVCCQGFMCWKMMAVLREVWALERWDLEELLRTLGTQSQKDLR